MRFFRIVDYEKYKVIAVALEKIGLIEEIVDPSSHHATPVKKNPPTKTYKFSPEDLVLAKDIHAKLVADNPRFSAGKNCNAWANEIRMFREIDNFSRREIFELFLFANAHSFWKKNILSPAKLRKNKNTLIIEMKSKDSGSKEDLVEKLDEIDKKYLGNPYE